MSFFTLAASLLGASADRKQRDHDAYLNSPAGIRAEAEKAGFNPLLFTGSAGSFGAGYAPTMGSKISNAFALAGDQNMREKELQLQKTELEQQNARLAEIAEASRLNVNRGGIYDQDVQVPDDYNHRDGSSGDPDDGNVTALGIDVIESPHMSSAQEFEDRYGDLASWVYGLGNLASDAATTAYRYGEEQTRSKAALDAADAARAKYGVEPYHPIKTTPLPELKGLSKQAQDAILNWWASTEWPTGSSSLNAN